jgi:hypothetical protein
MNILFSGLLMKSQDLNRDNMILLLHMIASRSWEGFYTQFIPQYIDQSNLTGHFTPQIKQRLLEGFGQATDAVSFKAAVERTIDDFNYFASAPN